MTVVITMQWDGFATTEYDLVREYVDWEDDPPTGAILHVASHDGRTLRVTDVWDSVDDFQAFVDTRLMPGVNKAGITSEPQVEIHPLHALFTPGIPGSG